MCGVVDDANATVADGVGNKINRGAGQPIRKRVDPRSVRGSNREVAGCFGGETHREVEFGRLVAKTRGRADSRATTHRAQTRHGRAERTGATCCLEHDQLARTETERRSSWRGALKLGRSDVAHDVMCIARVVESERKTEIGVGPDVVVHDTCRSLRRQDEMDPQTAPALSDTD